MSDKRQEVRIYEHDKQSSNIHLDNTIKWYDCGKGSTKIKHMKKTNTRGTFNTGGTICWLFSYKQSPFYGQVLFCVDTIDNIWF